MTESKCLACGMTVCAISDVKGNTVLLDKNIPSYIIFTTQQQTETAYCSERKSMPLHQPICDAILKGPNK